jgi:hypothetical protein
VMSSAGDASGGTPRDCDVRRSLPGPYSTPSRGSAARTPRSASCCEPWRPGIRVPDGFGPDRRGLPSPLGRGRARSADLRRAGAQ